MPGPSQVAKALFGEVRVLLDVGKRRRLGDPLAVTVQPNSETILPFAYHFLAYIEV